MMALLGALEREMLSAAASMPFGVVRHLRELGIEQSTIAQLIGVGDLAWSKVALEAGGGRWAPCGEHGRLLLAVRETGSLVDVVAVSSTKPGEWAMRLGAGVMLGFDHWVRVQVNGDGELPLFSRPLDWLRANCCGVCILAWDAVSIGMLRSLGEGVTIEVDEHAGGALEQLLARHGLPKVRERASGLAGRAAA